MINVTILLSALFAADGGATFNSTQPLLRGWWKAPSGSQTCLPDEQIAGCRVLLKEALPACYCPFPQH